MEVGGVKAPEMNAGIPAQRAGMPVDTKPAENKVESPVKPERIDAQSSQESEEEKKTVKTTVEAVNQFMQVMNADLKFALHEKTQRLMVQLIDPKDNRVLREYPSKEFLDMIARIRDFVGIFMDKKA